MGMPFVVCLSLTFHGGETQGESVLRKFKKRSCINVGYHEVDPRLSKQMISN